MPPPSYEGEQKALAEKEGLSTSPEEIDESSFQVAEVEIAPELYRDTESLLFRGFVCSVGFIGTVRVIWKSINHMEYDYLSLAYGEEASSAFQVAFLCKSVYLFDGHNVLGHSLNPELVSFFEELPPSILVEMEEQVRILNERAYKATKIVEAYTMEKASRWRWAQVSGQTLNSPSSTGIAGTDLLGQNFAQLTWQALNRAEDRLEEIETDWDHAKFIGSCFTKLNKIYASDNKRRRDNKIAKNRRKEQIIRCEILLEREEDIAQEEGLGRLNVARDAGDLARQVAAQVKGQKDFHDQVIEAAEAHIRDLERQKQENMAAVSAAVAEKYEGETYHGGASLGLPISPAELHQKLREVYKKPAVVQHGGQSFDQARMSRFGITR